LRSRGSLAAAGVRFTPLLVVWALYLTAFWGRFKEPWPQFVRDYAGFVVRGLWRLYIEHAGIRSASYTHHLLAWLVVSLVLGAAVPVVVMRLMGRGWGEMGLGAPNHWGWRVVAVCILVALPFAFFIAWEQPTATEAARTGFSRPLSRKLLFVASTVPEHILITGICVATFLPRARLPVLPALAPIEGTGTKRALRWLGLAQPGDPRRRLMHRLLAWFGLDGPAALAIAGGGVLFGIVHVGARPVTLASSFPGGMAVCYVTYRSRSVWPGWLVHVGELVLAQLFMLLLGRV